MSYEKIKLFFEHFLGEKSTDFIVLAQSGSDRVNFLAKCKDEKYIITYNENIQENESFFYYSKLFSDLKLNTPKIFTISNDRKIYIQEFLGSNTLSEIISEKGLNDLVVLLVKQALEKLYRLQTETKSLVDYTKAFEFESYNEFPITHDLYYFKNFVADVLEIQYNKSSLLKEFGEIADFISDINPKGLMIRDFQARNIMVNDSNEVSFIDYQSAMKGPLIYDVVSFLYQAKANFPNSFKNEMLDYYISRFKDIETKNLLRNSVRPIQMMRFLQVLGAYGFRGLIQKKPHFISSIHKGIENITEFARTWEDMKNYPELEKVINQLSSDKTNLKIKEILNY